MELVLDYSFNHPLSFDLSSSFLFELVFSLPEKVLQLKKGFFSLVCTLSVAFVSSDCHLAQMVKRKTLMSSSSSCRSIKKKFSWSPTLNMEINTLPDEDIEETVPLELQYLADPDATVPLDLLLSQAFKFPFHSPLAPTLEVKSNEFELPSTLILETIEHHLPSDYLHSTTVPPPTPPSSPIYFGELLPVNTVRHCKCNVSSLFCKCDCGDDEFCPILGEICICVCGPPAETEYHVRRGRCKHLLTLPTGSTVGTLVEELLDAGLMARGEYLHNNNKVLSPELSDVLQPAIVYEIYVNDKYPFFHPLDPEKPDHILWRDILAQHELKAQIMLDDPTGSNTLDCELVQDWQRGIDDSTWWTFASQVLTPTSVTTIIQSYKPAMA